MRGSGLRFDGLKDYVDVDNSALRFTGSLTITAWINPTSFPADDAVIVSHGQENGYQLDTTVDQGPRSVGFKLINACGKLMMRYGARPLATNTWYHVAGVYDSTARTLNVYVNGQLDNGPLVGVVTGTQRTSHGLLSLGRRPDQPGFGFSGIIDDVHIYSAALTTGEIEAVMMGEDVPAPPSVLNGNSTGPGNDSGCAMASDPQDRDIPIAAAASGILAAIAAVGFWPEAGLLFWLGSSLGAGGLLLFLIQTSLPTINNWIIPLTALVAGVSVIVSMRRND
jgi:hypothetical protein